MLSFSNASVSLNSSETKIFLIRHGETQWNALKKVQGHVDIPLNEKGISQAKKMAHVLNEQHSDITHIYCSDLMRSVATAEILAQKLNLTFSKNSNLREVYRGDSEGLTFKQADELYGDWKMCKAPGAETEQEAFIRIHSFLEEVGKSHPEAKIAIVTHGMLMEIFISKIRGIKRHLALSNCSAVELIYSPENSESPFRICEIFHLFQNEELIS